MEHSFEPQCERERNLNLEISNVPFLSGSSYNMYLGGDKPREMPIDPPSYDNHGDH